MQPINRLGIRVAVITIVLLLIVYGVYRGASALLSKPSPTPAITVQPQAVGQTDDSDQDGLADLLENVYASDPQRPDSDGDGTLDGAEVVAGRDPGKAGPNDKLVDTASGKPTIDAATYTGKYLVSLPGDLPQSEVLDKARVEAFVNANKGELLPTVDPVTIKTTKTTGKAAISAYLDAISAAHNPAIASITSSDIETAFRAYHANPQGSKELQDIYDKLRKNVSTLQAVGVPEEAKDIHIRLLAASMALTQNVELLLGETKDFIGGLIGAKNIEELGPVFAKLGEDIAALQKKYDIP